jgi:hypothetical protein
MKESTRLYSRVLSNGLLAVTSIAAYRPLGDFSWLVVGLITSAPAVFWIARARTVGDGLAPPLIDGVRRVAIGCGVTGGIMLVSMLWRVHGEWIRLGE